MELIAIIFAIYCIATYAVLTYVVINFGEFDLIDIALWCTAPLSFPVLVFIFIKLRNNDFRQQEELNSRKNRI